MVDIHIRKRIFIIGIILYIERKAWYRGSKMGNSIKRKLARYLAHKHTLNKTVLQMAKSWKEVCSILDKKDKKK